MGFGEDWKKLNERGLEMSGRGQDENKSRLQVYTEKMFGDVMTDTEREYLEVLAQSPVIETMLADQVEGFYIAENPNEFEQFEQELNFQACKTWREDAKAESNAGRHDMIVALNFIDLLRQRLD